jgi:hypothetical protein
MNDASCLNSAELLPIRASTPCVQLLAAPVGVAYGAAARVKSAGGSSGSNVQKVVVPLPAAGSSKEGSLASSSSSSGRGSSNGGQASVYGSEAWKEVTDAQKQQERRGGAAQGKANGKVSLSSRISPCEPNM